MAEYILPNGKVLVLEPGEMKPKRRYKDLPGYPSLLAHKGLWRRPTDGKIEFNWTDENGKTYWQTPADQTIKGALAAKAKIAVKKHDGARVSRPAKMTFNEAADAWLTSCTERINKPIRASTRRQYEGYLRRIRPEFGMRQLDKITTAEIVTFLRDLKSMRDNCTGAAARLHAYNVLRDVFKYAEHTNRRWITENPMRSLEKHDRPSPAKHDQRTLSKDEVDAIIAEIPSKYQLFYRLLAMTGLRTSEALGLQWRDIDLHASADTIGVVRVRRQRSPQGSSGRREEGPLKTDSGPRDVVLAPSLREMLLDHYLACGSPADSRFVFQVVVERTGRPSKNRVLVGDAPNGVSQIFQRAARAAGVNRHGMPTATTHDLRGTFISMLIESGTNIVAIAKQLGHTNTLEIQKTYAGLFDKEGNLKQISEAIEAAYGKRWVS